MKRPTEEITLAQYRAFTAKKAKPRREREPATGLSTMLAQGWAYTHNPAFGDRLTRGPLDTGWCEDERSCVSAARRAAVGDE